MKKKSSDKKSSIDSLYYFDEEAADKAVKFFAKYLKHSKGIFAGQPFILELWQLDGIIRPLFGWKRKSNGLRRYKECFLFIPRKNGKSTIGAGVGLFLTVADQEPVSEVYSAARDKGQAALIFDEAARMVHADSTLNKKLDVYGGNPNARGNKTIVHPQSGSFYKVVPADAESQMGLNAHGVIIDEVHTQPNRDLYDSLMTSRGTRAQPLAFLATTAGYDKSSFCYEMYEHAKRVKADPTIDPTFLPIIYEADPDDDWTDPKVWYKANPNLGIGITEEYLQEECNRAKELPSYENTFKRLYLNMWTEQETVWIQLDRWKKCKPLTKAIKESLKGRTCYAGIDLSTTIDMSAVALCFPLDDGTFALQLRYWMPADNIQKRIKQEGIRYDLWEKNKLLFLTPGDVIDYQYIQSEIDMLASEYDIQEIAYDPYNAHHLVQLLMQDGHNCVVFRQGFASMSPASKEFERIMLTGNIRHGNNQILTHNVSCAKIITDPAGNIKPMKPDRKQRGKYIDGLIASIMAVSRAAAGSKGHTVDDFIL